MAFAHTIAKAAEPHHETLRNKLRTADIAHADETGWRLDGKSAQLWYAGTPEFGFFHIDRSRSGDEPRMESNAEVGTRKPILRVPNPAFRVRIYPCSSASIRG